MRYRKIILQVTIFALLLILSSRAFAQTCQPAPVGLISWWSADGNTLDSRSRKNGTLQNGAGFAVGQVGQAFNFDGADDQLTSPHDNNQGINGAFSAEAWIFPRSLPNAGPRIFDKDDNLGTRWLMAINNSGPFVNSLTVAINGAGVSTPNNSITLNQWTHVAFTYDTARVRIYINGVESTNINIGNVVANPTAPLVIGDDSFANTPGDINARNFDGLIDEPAIYQRALSAAEIQTIAGAGSSGKCKPTAAVSPSGKVAWFTGDGDANDIAGTNNGTQNGAGFTLGKVGQAFSFDGIDDFISAPDSPSLDVQQFTAEAWVFPTSDMSGGAPDLLSFIVAKESVASNQYELGRRNNNGCGSGSGIPLGNFAFYIEGLTGLPNNCSGFVDGSGFLPLNTWSHVALTYDGANVRAFVNGALTRTIAATGTIPDTTGTLQIGGRTRANTSFWAGRIDEPSIYNRALTQAEITSIFNAGIAGKLKDNATPTGANVAVSTKGDAIVTFPNVTTAGTTQQIPLDASLFPPLPPGSFTGLAYDIATSASFTGNPTVCFNLPTFTPTQFANLRVVHFESGNWVIRTASSNTFPTLCSAPLPSLSPLEIVQVSPTAANVSISGRVITPTGQGVRGARLTLTAPDGTRRTAVTSSFGYYAFDGVEVGHTYVLEIASKRYTFANPTRILNLQDKVNDMDFNAEPQ